MRVYVSRRASRWVCCVWRCSSVLVRERRDDRIGSGMVIVISVWVEVGVVAVAAVVALPSPGLVEGAGGVSRDEDAAGDL